MGALLLILDFDYLKLLLILLFNEGRGGMGALLLILDFGIFEITAHII